MELHEYNIFEIDPKTLTSIELYGKIKDGGHGYNRTFICFVGDFIDEHKASTATVVKNWMLSHPSPFRIHWIVRSDVVDQVGVNLHKRFRRGKNIYAFTVDSPTNLIDIQWCNGYRDTIHLIYANHKVRLVILEAKLMKSK